VMNRQQLKEYYFKLRKSLYRKLENSFSHWHKRTHPWSDVKDVDFIRYKEAMVKASKFCYWSPWGWLPWSGIVIRRFYCDTKR